jgi:hypothetical protein
MLEFTELLSLSDHRCAEPRVSQIEVWDPLHNRWQWLNLFQCCRGVSCELPPPADTPLSRRLKLRGFLPHWDREPIRAIQHRPTTTVDSKSP